MSKVLLVASIAALPFVSVAARAQPVDGYQAGAKDRASFEQWFNSLSGDFHTGATYWVTHRSIPKEAHCSTDGDQLQGCLSAQQRLTPFDARRRSEPSYRLGWNGAPQAPTVAAAPLSSPVVATESLYHVQHNTYGCHNPRAALALTNPAEVRRSDPGWVNYVVNDGQCAPITPNSPWRMERLQGDLAVMSYAGTTGLPGTYYLRASDLSAPVVTTVAAPLPSAAQDGPSNFQSGLPPTPAYTPALPTTPMHEPSPLVNTYRSPVASDSYSNPASPIVVAAGPPAPQQAQPSFNAGSTQTDGSGNLTGVLIFLGIIAVVAAIIIAKTRAERARIEAANARRRKATAIAFGEVSDKAHLLHVRREQLTQPDFYGTIDTGKWEKEKISFVQTRVVPLLNDTGLADLAAEILPLVFGEMEAASWRPIAPAMRGTFSNPEVYSPDMDPIHYEMHCAFQLQKAGWITKATPRTGDQGADVLAERGGVTLVVQCKLYSNNVGNGAVQEAVAARIFHRTNLAAVVSNAAFTKSARELAGMSDVTLLHHSQLPAYTGRSGPTEVLRVAG